MFKVVFTPAETDLSIQLAHAGTISEAARLLDYKTQEYKHALGPGHFEIEHGSENDRSRGRWPDAHLAEPLLLPAPAPVKIAPLSTLEVLTAFACSDWARP